MQGTELAAAAAAIITHRAIWARTWPTGAAPLKTPPSGSIGPLNTAKQNRASSAVPPAATRARLRGSALGAGAAATAGTGRAAGAGRTGLIFWIGTCSDSQNRSSCQLRSKAYLHSQER